MNKRNHSTSVATVLSIFFISLFFITACFKNDDPDLIVNPPGPTPPSEENIVQLIGAYTNQFDDSLMAVVPTFTYDADSSDSRIKVDSAFAHPTPGSFLEIDVVLRDLQISDTRLDASGDTIIDIYQITNIDDIVVEERRNNRDWLSDTEFEIVQGIRLEEVAVVIVLDVSLSLEDQFRAVKTAAKDFVDFMFESSESPFIGVVIFSTQITLMSFSDDAESIKTFIDNAEQGEFTSLYTAMITGIEMLIPINVDLKTIVTFTDGINNFRESDPAQVLDRLEENDDIISYTLGFTGSSGNIDAEVLDAFATNGGRFFLVETTSALRSRYELISSEVSQRYNLTYRRNNQEITDADSLYIRFSIPTEIADTDTLPAQGTTKF